VKAYSKRINEIVSCTLRLTHLYIGAKMRRRSVKGTRRKGGEENGNIPATRLKKAFCL